MKIVTINVPDDYLDALEVLVNLGFYPSRSEAVRQALKQFLTNEAQVKEDISKDRFKELKSKQMEAMLHMK